VELRADGAVVNVDQPLAFRYEATLAMHTSSVHTSSVHAFRYEATPAVASLRPLLGSAGADVTLTGSAFVDAYEAACAFVLLSPKGVP